MYGDLPPPVMLIGHSMGGAIAVHTASANLVPSLLGLCMIDVVEGEFSKYWPNRIQEFIRDILVHYSQFSLVLKYERVFVPL